MKSFFEEFKTFALRGNVVDMAVGIVIGAAFGKIVSSLVANIVTPLLGLFLGGIHFTDLAFSLGGTSITYGFFIQSIIDFVIIAFAIFVVIRMMNALQKRQDEAPESEKPAEPAEDIKLLREIRDELRRK